MNLPPPGAPIPHVSQVTQLQVRRFDNLHSFETHPNYLMGLKSRVVRAEVRVSDVLKSNITNLVSANSRRALARPFFYAPNIDGNRALQSLSINSINTE